MKSIYNKGARTIQFKAGSISPNQSLEVEDEVAALLLSLFKDEVIIAGSTDDSLKAELEATKAELAALKGGKKTPKAEKVTEAQEVAGESAPVELVDMKLSALKLEATAKGLDFPAGISKEKLLELLGN